MAVSTIFSRFLQVNSEYAEVRRKGRLVQILVITLTLVGLGHALLTLLREVEGTMSPITFIPPLGQAIIMPVFGLFCLFIVRAGRPRLAAHIFLTAINFIFFTVLVNSGNVSTLPYLMLIAVVAISILDSVLASVIYAAVTITAVALYVYTSGDLTIDYLFAYILTALGISLATWISARDLQKSLKSTNQLAQNLQKTSGLLQRRARQLQRSAEVSQMTSINLDLDQLLHDAVYIIREQFDLYYVSIYLLDENQERLVLREAAGQSGEMLKARRYAIALGSRSIISWVATNRKARITLDVAEDPLYLSEPLLAETRSELALPLLARGQLLGVLDVQSRETKTFQEEDIAILQIMANQIAVNIDNARLFTQAESHLNETKALLTLNTLVTTTLDVGEIYRRSARAFAEQLTVTRALIFSLDQPGNSVVAQVEFISGTVQGATDDYMMRTSDYDPARYASLRQVLQSGNSSICHIDDPDLEPAEREVLLSMGQAVCLKVPLIRGIDAVGVVALFRTRSQPPFSAAEIQLAQAMANQTAIAVDNASLASEMQGRIAQLSMLNRMSTILSLAPTLKDIFDGARREILSLVEATGMSISLLTPEGDMLNWIYGFEYGREVDLSAVPPLPISEGFSGHVAQTREVLHINHKIEEMHQKFRSRTVGVPSAAWLGLPLIVANKLIGVLAVENEHDSQAFAERDIQILKTISGPLAIAINNLLQFETVQAALEAQSRQRVQLQAAAEVAAAATSILNAAELMQKGVDLIKERFNLYYVGLFLVESSTNEASLKAATGEAGRLQLEEGRSLPVGGRSLIGGATRDGVARITQDVSQDKEWLSNPHLPETRAELALPLRVRGRIIGALTVQSVTSNAFSPELISTLQTMSDQLATAIENAQLLAQAEAGARRQRDLNQITARLHQSADVNEIVAIGLQALSEHLAGAEVALVLGSRAAAEGYDE